MTHRHDFASDNTAGISPEAWRALEEANADTDQSYGGDRWTERLRDLLREIFETDCEVFMVFNGTAANSLALAQLCQPFHAIVCHERAHIYTDECAAPEFMSGGAKLLTVAGANGKLNLATVEETLAKYCDVHSSKPHVISVTNSTECGTVYTRDELARVAELARSRDLRLHMDGARFANAIASLGCAPKEITWQLGFDVLCFGGTKNGTGAGEVVIFFNKALAEEFDYRVKQAAQLASKMRFLSAPWCGLLQDGAWLRHAQHANRSAGLLSRKLRDAIGAEPVFPREASALFVRLPEQVVAAMHARGWHFHAFFEPDLYRLMCSWATTEQQIDQLVADLKAAQRV
ncbi:MAG: threonine aldolase family protein [Chthoniobacterales bacterium]